jgi:hypothetical protein
MVEAAVTAGELQARRLSQFESRRMLGNYLAHFHGQPRYHCNNYLLQMQNAQPQGGALAGLGSLFGAL